MEALRSSVTAATTVYKLRIPFIQYSGANSVKFPISGKSRISPSIKARAASVPTSTSNSSGASERNHWMVLMDKPPEGVNSKPEILNYYVKTLERVLGSENDAQACIYHPSYDTNFGFCCNIEEEASLKLSSLPEVLSVRLDPDYNSVKKDYIESSKETNNRVGCLPLFPSGNTKHWLVRLHGPGVGFVTKAQMVDYYAQILTKVLRNEKDAQMCIYHVSWQSNSGFCCELDDECAKELAGVPGVLSVELDRNYLSDNKDYAGNNLENSANQPETSQASGTMPRTKKLFVTGLSFYTSEKTLRAAFEGFGELVEVKIIMDNISKRSKGYAFIEYTTEDAAGAALKDMNGKIINGWMITVDVARSRSYKFTRDPPSQTV